MAADAISPAANPAGTAAVSAPQTPTLARPITPTPAPVSTPKPVSLESSYRREYTLLQTQKSELQNRLRAFKAQADSTENALQQKNIALGQSNVSLAAKEETLREQLVKTEHSSAAAQDNNDLLEMTYSQANASLAPYQRSQEKAAEFIKAGPEQKLRMLFQQGTLLINDLAQVKQNESVFFLNDGTETKGKIIRVGNIAAYGVSNKGSGILIPAGDGHLKLLSQPAAETAEALAANKTIALQKIYIYENKDKAVQEKQEKTFMQEVAEGGEIAWIILGLGVLSIFLILGRILVLWFAARGKTTIVKKATNLLLEDRQVEAMLFCEKHRGPFARVLAAIIRNANVDPKQMDDVIEESLLHETGPLNRFGAPIVVIASLAPLVGLLGTVTGMIATFGLITEHGTGDPRLLSSGIAIALVTTELGLIVAIPAGLAGSLLGSWSEGIKTHLEEIALRASNILLDNKHARLQGQHQREEHV